MKKIVTSLVSIWISYVFLISLTFKFTDDPETQHIFGTIGEWISSIFGETIGSGFTNYGAYVIGTGEGIISILLLIPVLMYIMKLLGGFKSKIVPEYLFALGGLGAVMIMSGAIFFHLFTPLGVEVNNDGGSLFRAAVSIWVLGLALFVTNFKSLFTLIKKLIEVMGFGKQM